MNAVETIPSSLSEPILTFYPSDLSSFLYFPGGSDERHPNKVRLTITIPHRDGMMPVISTRQLSNFELTLSKDGTRLASHRCSNLLDFNEVSIRGNFVLSLEPYSQIRLLSSFLTINIEILL